MTLPAPSSGQTLRRVAWRPELSFASSLNLPPTQHEVLVSVNRWLARSIGQDLPRVPAAERSLEIFGDENLISRDGGRTLWQTGRLDEQLLRFEREVPLIVWEPAGAGDVLLVVENQATFMSAVRVLRERGSARYGAVAWGEGGQCEKRIETAGRAGMQRIKYFGDLDAGGLRIAAAADRAAQAAGLGGVAPAVRLYDLLPEHGIEQQGVSVTDPAGLGWLAAHQRDAVRKLLESGKRHAQEAVGYRMMLHDSSWR